MIMREPWRAQLSHADPLKVQSQYAAFGKIDASQLFVGRRFSGCLVAVHVEHCRYLTVELCGFIQQRWNPQAGQCLKTELSNAVAMVGLDDVAPNHSRLSFAPRRRHATKYYFFAHTLTDSSGLLLPGLGGFGSLQLGDARKDKLVELFCCFFLRN